MVLTCKPVFGAPNCLVRALRYDHRHMTEHPELRKGRHHLFIPFKDNNAGKEPLSLIDLHHYTGFIRGREIGKKAGILNRLFQGLE